MKNYVPPGFELCPEEFEKIKLIAYRLLNWTFGYVIKDGEICHETARWLDLHGKIQCAVDDFNPIISLQSAFLVLTEMRRYGTWTLEFPDRDNARATFAPYTSEPVTFICFSLENAITTVVYEWLMVGNLKEEGDAE
jgi:hypothetical protein